MTYVRTLGRREMQICLLCIAVRIVFIFLFHLWPGFAVEYMHDLEGEHFARTLISDGSMTSPYVPDKGLPSAWRTPTHSLLLALLLLLSGGNTPVYCLLIYVLWSLLSCIAVVLLMRITQYSLGRRAALFAGVLYAIFPPAIYYATNATCDAVLVTVGLTLVVWAGIRLREDGSMRMAICFGTVIGSITLINPAAVPVGAAIACWALGLRKIPIIRRATNVGMIVLVTLLILSPWMARNRLTFGEPVFLRSNFGFELWSGNSGPGRTYISQERFLLSRPEEVALLAQLGEPAYNRRCRDLALEWIRRNPLKFLQTSAERVGVFWGKEVFFGRMPKVTCVAVGIPFLLSLAGVYLVVKRRISAVPLLLPLVVYPLVYYLTHVEARYRHPIEIFYLAFGGYALAAAWGKLQERRRRLGTAFRIQMHGVKRQEPQRFNTPTPLPLSSRAACSGDTPGVAG